MRSLQNIKKIALTVETLRLSYDTTFGTKTHITWSKSKKK